MDSHYFSYQTMPSDAAPVSAHSLSPQSRAPAQNGRAATRIVAPEDVDGALRYSPLTSVVPVSGGKTSFLLVKSLISLLVLDTLPLPQFTPNFPTRLAPNQEQQQRTSEYLSLMNRRAQSSTELALQKDELENTLNLIGKVEDGYLYVYKPMPLIAVVSRHLPMPPTLQQHLLSIPTPQARLISDHLHRKSWSKQLLISVVNNNYQLYLTSDPTPLTPENHPFTPHRYAHHLQQAGGSPSPAMTGHELNHLATSKNTFQPQSSRRMQTFSVDITTRPMQPTPASSVASSSYKRQKNSHNQYERQSVSPTPTRRVMEKDRVDGLVSQFMTFLEDIFEAEDAFNPDAEHPTEGFRLFFSLDSLREERPWLSRETHRKLDTHIRKLRKTIAAREGLRINTQDLARITGICERAVKAADMLNLKEIDADETAEREWIVEKLQRVENAILASNVIMLLIKGRGTDQQVCVSVMRLTIDLF